jgi:peptidyl-dipeptidase Dcp
VRAWEVTGPTGDHVGLFYADYFARPSKRSGAWMSTFRDQEKLAGDIRPIVVNVMNFSRAADGEPSLLSFDDARTLFHEFGHGLHGLLSNVTFPLLSGTSVATDFVELPSQLFERWLEQPEVLQTPGDQWDEAVHTRHASGVRHNQQDTIVLPDNLFKGRRTDRLIQSGS